jgi:hypothetical protein
MRHLNALHAHVEEAQDKGRVEAGGAHDRGDADPLRRHDHQLDVAQIEAGVLHVDEGGVEAGEADDLDDLRVGDAAGVGAEGKPAFGQNALYPVLLHRFLLIVIPAEARIHHSASRERISGSQLSPGRRLKISPYVCG